MNESRQRVPSDAAVRETIESIVVAFILAFLFRTFAAEAFVIPTGSMAPTLMGRHKDVECPQCHFWYQVNASDEVDSMTGADRGEAYEVQECTCPMCRYTMDVGSTKAIKEAHPSYKGDRILVSKFSYDFRGPERWDVTVFRYPGSAGTNYIKRLVGLPNETIRISQGDIFVRRDGETSFAIARKTPDKLLAMLQPVYDNQYVLPDLIPQGWPLRWQPVESRATARGGGWVASADFCDFQTNGAARGTAWLRYRHCVPSFRQWEAIVRGETLPADDRPLPQMISDFTAYNSNRERGAISMHLVPETDGLHWVGDLALECTLESQSDKGEAVLELVKGGRLFQCRFDLATGAARLSIDGLPDFAPAAATAIRGRGTHDLRFSNIDEQLLLWVDGRLARFDAPTSYPPLGNTRPNDRDLAPVGIGSDKASLRVGRLRIFRDIYYIAERHRPGMGYEGELPRADFELGPDQFLMLGDNSARSMDSRLWEQKGIEPFVRRELLIGRAVYIYWPHSWDKVPATNIPFPFFPNFARMGFVR